MGKAGRIALRKSTGSPPEEASSCWLMGGVMISEANCHMRANLTQATGTPGVSETSGTVQTLRIETGPFKETDRGESIPVIFYVEWTLLRIRAPPGSFRAAQNVCTRPCALSGAHESRASQTGFCGIEFCT